MAISVTNTSRRPVTLVLLGDDSSAVEYSFVQGERRVRRRVPGSLTVMPGEVRTGLPDEIAAHARAQGLTVREMPTDEQPADQEQDSESEPVQDDAEQTAPRNRKSKRSA